MRKFIVKMGHLQSVAAITVISCLASVLIALLISYGYSWFGMRLSVNVAIASIVPLILTPPLSWYLLGLLIKIDQLEAEMRKAATFDPLTGLFTRRAFMERAEYALDLAARDGFEVSVLLVDLDHFKKINDQFGHATGDNVLTTFGRIIAQITRKSDVVGRLGGEEFAFLLPDTSRDQARNFSERLHEVTGNTIFGNAESSIRITMSVGIVTLPEGTESSVEKLLVMADDAMYTAKENGRNQSAIYNEILQGTG